MTLVISLGGSIIVPEAIDSGFLKGFCSLIRQISKKEKLIIVTGGGKTARNYQKAANEISVVTPDDLDWMGIRATRMNADLLRTILSDVADEKIIIDPTKKPVSKKKVIFAGGWKPGFSTDMVAVLIAEQLKVKTVINLSDVDYIYNTSPSNPKAKPIKNINWSQFYLLFGKSWSPGLNSPFDPVASRKAEELGMKVLFTNGRNIENLEKVFLSAKKKNISTKDFIGTIIDK